MQIGKPMFGKFVTAGTWFAIGAALTKFIKIGCIPYCLEWWLYIGAGAFWLNEVECVSYEKINWNDEKGCSLLHIGALYEAIFLIGLAEIGRIWLKWMKIL